MFAADNQPQLNHNDPHKPHHKPQPPQFSRDDGPNN